ncbi:hypothetical protein [Paraliomyxa miuraensis]|uniref:hypothetical protein n=1 Tax=Paraliomyxa miuraensis TaxID=376150 RepID=UPI002256BDF4|nr:hypothetical protein [Paraliomyxa miuraensis]MCX4247658.1 hypothetical protein [Paraliomyxa miuraensis]
MSPRPIAIIAFTALVAACGADTGAVELAWTFVDRDGDPIYPGGVFTIDAERDSCELPGRFTESEVPFSLHVELEICDPGCEAGCDDESCLVVPRQKFPCTTARGNEPEVPSTDTPYRFTVRAILSAPALDLECRDPAPDCLAIPASRERLVRAGLVTDLQVQQIVVDLDREGSGDEARLDLGELCGCA